MIHQLDAALDDIHGFVEKGGIDDLQNVGMRLVFGVKNGHDVPSGDFQTQIQLVRFASMRIIGDQQLDIGGLQLFQLFLRNSDGPGIVFAQQGQYLHQLLWIMQIVDLLDRFRIELFLVIRGQQNGERELRITINSGRAVEQGLFWLFPDIEAQADIKNGLRGHQADQRQIDILERRNNGHGHLFFP
jgi:hypothetical protein